RPVAVKIAEAAQRYRERVGFEPTTCQLNPAQANLPVAPQHARKRKSTLTVPVPALRLVPNASLRPNYFFVGIEEGERAKRVPGWRPDDEEGYSAIVRRPATASHPLRSALPAAPGTMAPSEPVAAASAGSTARASRRTRGTSSPAA